MSTKIVVMTDIHANLPALQAALHVIRQEGYDAIFHTGDAIALGPYPAECLDMLFTIPKITFVMGNHDAYFVAGLTETQQSWMSEGEIHHQHWTHAALNKQLRLTVAQWPCTVIHDFEGVKTTFVHYALKSSECDFVPIIKHPTPIDLDDLFKFHNSALLFYGHHHPFSDIQGQARYVNPGSLGCSNRAVARYAVVEFQKGQFKIAYREVLYDDTELFEAFERRNVPEREFICRVFFGARNGRDRTTR
jgi:predicted phosphodiesterase